MELLDTIKTLIKPILENNDVYLDDIEYLQENGEWYLRIFVEKNEGSLDMDTCVEKPLKTFEQVKASVGKYVYAKFINPTAGMDEVEGFIKTIEDETIEFEYLVKNIKKRIKIDYSNIKFIRLAVKF